MNETENRVRLRKATGPDRPSYFDTGDVDRVMAILLALVSEVATIRERLDTHERLGDAGTFPNRDDVEGYVASAPADADREAWRDAYIKRLFRVITEDIEALSHQQPSPDDRSD